MLAAVFDRVGASAYSLAARIVGDRAKAEDLVASVFTTVYEDSTAGPDVVDRVGARLLRLTRSQSLSARRDDGSGSNRTLTEDIPELAAVRVPALPSEDELDRLRESWLTLPPAMRYGIELVFFEGRTQTEVASRLDLSVEATRRAIFRGLTTLRDEMRQAR